MGTVMPKLIFARPPEAVWRAIVEAMMFDQTAAALVRFLLAPESSWSALQARCLIAGVRST
jgi:hypothetical protein